MRTARELVDSRTDCQRCFGTGMLPWPSRLEVIELRSCACGAHDPGVWGGYRHPVTLVTGGDGWVAWVDVGVAADIERLWGEGIPTWVSCQGDSEWYRYVGVAGLEHLEAASALLPWARCITVRPDVGDLIFGSQ